MRTTITLDDGLLERLKKRAAESGTSVSGLIERAVRLLLQASAPQRRDRFDLAARPFRFGDVRRGRSVHDLEYR